MENIVTDDTKITDVVTDDSKKTEEEKVAEKAAADLKAKETAEAKSLADGTAPKKPDATPPPEPEPVEHVAFKLREEKRASAALAAENADLKARLSTPPDAKEPDIAPYLDEEGNFKDAKSQTEYNKKLFDWQGDQRDKVNEQKALLRRNNEAMESLNAGYIADAEKVSIKYPDFYEVVEKSQFTFAMEKAIKMSSNKAEVAYYICKNPALQKQLQGSDPVEAALEIQKVDMQLTQNLNKKIVTKAPPPINPITGGQEDVTDETKLSTANFIKRRNEKEFKNK